MLDDDSIEHDILKLKAKVKEKLLESQQKQNEACSGLLGHGIFKRNIWGACQCALKKKS